MTHEFPKGCPHDWFPALNSRGWLTGWRCAYRRCRAVRGLLDA